MITKTIEAVVEAGIIKANTIHYRVFGILVYKKILIIPCDEVVNLEAYIYQF